MPSGSSPTAASTSSSSSSSAPCAACKLLRRKCTKECIFAPYFSPDEPQKFAFVHKVFGASNVSKMLQDLPVHQRMDAVSSIVYEANARICDPVYGCVGAISSLQQQVVNLHKQLALAQAEMVCLRMQQQQPQGGKVLPVVSSPMLSSNRSEHGALGNKFSGFTSAGLETIEALGSMWGCH